MSPARLPQPAPVLLTAQPGALASAPKMSVATATRALHIPAEVLAQPGLSLLACAVLAEVLDLQKVRGRVFASDEHFAERCKCSARKSRETIAELEAAGYLSREVDYSRRHKRLLVPTEKWQNLPEVVAESATSTLEVVAESAGSSGEICRDLWQILPGVVAESANINTLLNTKGNTTLNNDAAGAAALGSEKKIGEDFSSTALPAEAEVSTPPVAAAPPAKLHLMRLSAVATFPAFVEAWQAAVEANPEAYADFAQANLLHYHTALLDWSNANGKKKIDWLATIRASMRSDETKGQLRKARPAGTSADSPVLKRLATAEAAFALNDYDEAGNRLN
jgi:septal ring-binding cell division protein DamX